MSPHVSGYDVSVSDQHRRERLAGNEAVFRDINARMDARLERWEHLDQAFQRLVCECSDTTCTETIAVTPAEHRWIRDNAARFLIARGHDDADIERVVYRHDRFWVVQKHADLVT